MKDLVKLNFPDSRTNSLSTCLCSLSHQDCLKGQDPHNTNLVNKESTMNAFWTNPQKTEKKKKESDEKVGVNIEAGKKLGLEHRESNPNKIQ